MRSIYAWSEGPARKPGNRDFRFVAESATHSTAHEPIALDAVSTAAARMVPPMGGLEVSGADMSVDLGGGEVGVPEQHLKRT